VRLTVRCLLDESPLTDLVASFLTEISLSEYGLSTFLLVFHSLKFILALNAQEAHEKVKSSDALLWTKS
jgi:hypothetical protein